jgi:hypothetical protein
MNELQPLVQQMIARWRAENIPIPLGVDAVTIAEFEFKHRVKLPCDLQEFYSTVNGMGNEYDEEGFFRFWPLEEVKPIEEYVPELVEAFPESAGYFFFFDHSIDLFMYAIRLGNSETLPTPIAHVFPQTDGLSFDHFLGSFAKFVSIYVNNPDGLLQLS